MQKIKLMFYTLIEFVLFNKNKKKYILFSESKYYRNHFEKLTEDWHDYLKKEYFSIELKGMISL